MTVTVRSPAKINLALSVGGPDDTGYHAIATVYQAVSLYDEVHARPADDGSVTLSITGEGADDLPLDGTNLAVRAAELLRERLGVDAGVQLAINRTIAVSGGLAGGSTDAAATLLACDELWGTRVPRDELLALAAELGSDVPFCLTGGNAIGTGRGEVLSPVLARGTYEWVLAYADGELATPEVYSRLDAMRGPEEVAEPEVPDTVMSALRGGDAYALGEALSNDLQAPALQMRPSLRRVLGMADEAGALGSLVSGSGPTCLFLASGEEHAIDIAVSLSSSGLCRSVQRASGPVPGARLLGRSQPGSP